MQVSPTAGQRRVGQGSWRAGVAELVMVAGASKSDFV